MSVGGIIIWVAIAIIAILLRKRIAGTIVAVIVFICAIFLFVGLWQGSGASIDLGRYIPLGWFHDTVNNPKKTAEDIVEGGKTLGSKANEEVNKQGQKIDDALGVTIDSTGINFSNEESKETVDSTTTSSSEEMSDYVKIGKGEKTTDAEVIEDAKIKLTEVEDYIKANSHLLTKHDKELLRGANEYLKDKVKGDKVSFYVNEDNLLVIKAL